MSINDLKKLQADGHTIGGHTTTHARLSTISSKNLHDEIVYGADLLESYLGTLVRHFAYPLGDFNSINAEVCKLARKRFDYVYTGMRGNNSTVVLHGIFDVNLMILMILFGTQAHVLKVVQTFCMKRNTKFAKTGLGK